jgi:peptide deformylase
MEAEIARVADSPTGMAIRPIVLYPDPVLLRPTRRVESIDDEIRDLVRDMTETMYAAPGIGLAANQVGSAWRVCLVDLSAGERSDELHVLINPEVLSTEGRQIGEEGCLSFPDVTLEIERAERAMIRALDLDGRTYEIEASGLFCRAILHECEHLDGKVFLQNVSPLKRELVKKQIRKRIKAGDWVAETAGT